MDVQDFRIGNISDAACPARNDAAWKLMSGVFHGERGRESAATPAVDSPRACSDARGRR